MMQVRKFGLVFVIFMLTTFMLFTNFVLADDENDDNDDHDEYEYEEHDDHEYEGRDEYESHENDEDDDHERYEEYEHEEYQDRSYPNQDAPLTTIKKMETWDTWTRSSSNALSYAQLPFMNEQKASVQTENKSTEMNVIPYQGQIFVPIEEVSNLIGAEFSYYKNAQAAEVILKEHHLIVKEGSRVIYENMKKTPMPQPALSKNKALYVPISVIANGLGYKVSWSDQEGFLLKEGADGSAK